MKHMVVRLAGKRAHTVVSILTLGVLAAAVPGGPVRAAQAPASAGTLAAAFDAASQQFRVPEDLLLAVSYLETRWNAKYLGSETGVPAYGPMALYETAKGKGTLVQAASDLG